jgi:hypothetical protein
MPAHHLLAAAAPDPLLGSTLFVCLFVCLLATGPLARPALHARRRVVMAYSRLAAQESVRALVRRHHPRRATATRRHGATAYASRFPKRRVLTVLLASRARARVATPTDLVACEHPIAHKRKAATAAPRCSCVQRLEVLVAVMLARERLSPADAAADGRTELAAALAALPSRPLEMIAEAVAALGCADP